jgi:hypothetical protein
LQIQALRIAVAEAHEKGGAKLRALADKLVEEGLAGNVHALKEIADRLDGRVPQAQVISLDEDGKPIRLIAIVPAKAESTEAWLEACGLQDKVIDAIAQRMSIPEWQFLACNSYSDPLPLWRD